MALIEIDGLPSYKMEIFHGKMLVITRWYIPLNRIKYHKTTIFLWFSYGFPSSSWQKKQGSGDVNLPGSAAILLKDDLGVLERWDFARIF
jgi:hypothetical protein